MFKVGSSTFVLRPINKKDEPTSGLKDVPSLVTYQSAFVNQLNQQVVLKPGHMNVNT